MSESQGNTLTPATHKPGGSNLARERLLWAVRPIGLLMLVLWVLHPSVADHSDYIRLGLMGFLVGTAYGLVLYGKKLRKYISLKESSQRLRQNRVPEEYYWGHVAKVMYDNK